MARAHKYPYGSILFIAIAAIAIFLRFYKIGGADFLCVDEYLYYFGANVGMTLRELVSHFGKIIADGQLGTYISALTKHLPYICRPGYYFFAGIATAILGESKTTAFCLSAFFGVMTVFMTYLLSRRLFSSKAMALVALLLVSVSAGHVFISRAAYATPGAVFFVALTFYLYVRSRSGGGESRPIFWLALSSVAYGIAFSVHPSVYYIAPAIAMLEIQRMIAGYKSYKSILSLFKNLSIFFSLFILTILIWEIPHFATYLYFLAKGAIPLSANYFASLRNINNMYSYLYELLSYTTTYNVPLSLEFRGLAYFPAFIIASEGWAYLVVLTCAVLYFIVKAIRTRFTDYRYLMIPLWILCIYLLYSTVEVHPIYEKGTKEIRVFMQIYPAMAIAISFFLMEMFKFCKRRTSKIFLMFVLFCLIATSGVRAYGLIATQANLAPMNNYLKTHPGIDKVILNINNCGFSPVIKVADGLDGFRAVNWDRNEGGQYETMKDGGRVGVFYRDAKAFERMPIVIKDHSWAIWNEDVRDMYKKGEARYLISTVFDSQWFSESPFKKGPLFSYPGPFVCKIRLFDIGMPLYKMESFRKNNYFNRIGIYDLADAFD